MGTQTALLSLQILIKNILQSKIKWSRIVPEGNTAYVVIILHEHHSHYVLLLSVMIAKSVLFFFFLFDYDVMAFAVDSRNILVCEWEKTQDGQNPKL